MVATEREINIKIKADGDSAAKAIRAIRRTLAAELRQLADEVEGSAGDG